MGYHEPVLLKESIHGLMVKPGGIYIDATYGGGGHSKEILKQLKNGRLIAFDRDVDAVANAVADERFSLIRDNYSHLSSRLSAAGISQADGILADLGISSHQIDVAERGFSTRYDALLDMRMDRNMEFTARDVLNVYSEKDLVRVFSEYGEIRNSKQLASIIVKARAEKPLETTSQLKAAIKSCIPFNREHQYLAQLFQALRIEVNGELESLKEFLEQSADVLKSGGRLAVISYHSLEDRLVKNMINTGNTDGTVQKDIYGNVTGKKFRAVNKKPVVAEEEELKRNPRSRSARLRIAEKI